MAERPRLPADVVEYFLFPETPTFVEDSELEELLCRKHDEYLASLSHLLVGYIWQNEPFRLKPITGDADLPPHLYGRVHFGDNIDDEWFIVYLLLQLTKQFPNLIVRVNDNDGEFLLIEAADVLPKWANPDSAENRVYTYKGEIHLIPIPESPAEITSLPLFISTIREAVDCVRDSPTATRASDQIQAAISNKLSPFPAKVHENLHRSHCYVPAALAAILTTKPSLVAPAVQAFYYRDPLDLKACRTMKYFRPGTRVTAQVTFTRCLYAQLMQQKFTPDQRSGFVLPSQSAPHFKSHDLGMKLAHGFEILCSKCSVGQVNGTNGSNFQSDIRWKRYLKSLTDKGFFRDEIPGSRLHQQLQDSAYKFYKENVINNQSSSTEPGEEILKLLNTVKFDIEDMRRSETSLPPPDDDSWLDLSAEELDEMLMKISGRTEPMADSMNTSNITESMKTFVESVSTHEGAEFPSETGEGEIQFDSTGFIHAMQKMFEFEDDKSDSGSSMSEYGWETDSDDELGSPSLRGPTSRPSSHTSSRITHSSQQAARPATRPAPPSRPPQPNVRPSSKHNVPTGRPSTRPPRPPGPSLPGKQKDGRSIEEYMDMMDRELAQTNVGKSFVRESVPVPKPRRKKQVNGAVPDSRPDIDDEDDDFTPVNIDVNTVKNMLQSYEAQQGLPGPASNILNSMGVRLTESGRTNGQSKYNPFK